uniref:SMB domain-containing protein n=1 Tax=Strongyloides papillosus TaxID=174720 RepID=A0A0N5B9R1_STREA
MILILKRSTKKSLWKIIFFLLSINISFINGGCYQRQLCCRGKNNTCKDIDDGIRHLPIAVRWPGQVPKNYHYDWRERPSIVYTKDDNEKLGRLVLPDILQVNEDGLQYLKSYESNEYDKDYLFDEMLTDNDDEYVQGMDDDETIEILHFGDEFEDPPPHQEHIKYLDSDNRTHAYIRYSLINRYIPVRVEKVKKRTRHRMRHEKVRKLGKNKIDKLVPLEHQSNDKKKITGVDEGDEKARWREENYRYKSQGNVECYCDGACLKFGDCCSDYTFVCPPVDCKTSEWERWSDCVADDKDVGCGIGQRVRRRYIVRKAENGGNRCGELEETVSCFKECKKRSNRFGLFDETTVALIIDYKYNMSRKYDKKMNKIWNIPKVVEKLKNLQYYCVEYQIDWLNQNCIEEIFKKTLYKGSIICGECQPEAQLHRKDHRCASDLENGEVGFWKLIGPKSCNGIWRRITRTDKCRCSTMLPHLYPYLLV